LKLKLGEISLLSCCRVSIDMRKNRWGLYVAF
jgi:hypothetical protein